MGWLTFVIGISATIIFWWDDYLFLAIVSALLALVDLWLWGIMHNYATEAAKKRPDYTGGFYDITPQEADAVPDWISAVSMLMALGTLVALIGSLILWWL